MTNRKTKQTTDFSTLTTDVDVDNDVNEGLMVDSVVFVSVYCHEAVKDTTNMDGKWMCRVAN